MKKLLFAVIYLTLTFQGFSQSGPTMTITADEVNDGDTSTDSALSLTFTSSDDISLISHNDNEVSCGSSTGEIWLRPSNWSLGSDIDHSLHQRNGTFEINGVTFTITGLVSANSSFITYSVTPNPPTNGVFYNSYYDVTTNYNPFGKEQIIVSGGNISNFADTSPSVYTATFTPSGPDVDKTIDVAANIFTDSSGNYNSAATQFNWTYNTTPAITITAAEVISGGTSNDSALSLTFTTSLATTNFNAGDITVSGGNISNFADTSPSVYTATFTPFGGDGPKTIDVAANTFTNINGTDNSAATQFNWTYDGTATMTITADEVNDGDTSNDSALSLTFTSSDDISLISHNDNEVSCGSSTGEIWLRPSNWSLGSDIDHSLHQRNGTFEINGVTFTITGLVSANSSFITYSVTPNPPTNGVFYNSYYDVTTNYNPFSAGAITVSGGNISNFADTSPSVYTATFTPSGGDGPKTIDVAANIFTDSAGNNSSAATQFNWTYDTSITFNNSSGNNQWSTASNWSSGSVPISSSNIRIPTGLTVEVGASGSGTATSAYTNNLIIDSDGGITIAKNSNLTLSGDFTNNGTVTLNSDSTNFSSIIISGTVSDGSNITYNRYVNAVGTNGWDLIGSPVDAVSIYTFVSNNTSGTATLATNGSAYAVGEYDNATDTWTNYTTDTAGVDEAAGNFDIGKGYQMASVDGGTELLKFTGAPVSTTQTQEIINNDAANSGTGRRWNLVANPFPSYINGNDDAHSTNNFLTVNASKMDSPYVAIYGYDADGSGYTAYNHTYNINTAIRIAPGQAFMVASNSTSSDNVSFTPAMRTVQGGDDFISGRIINPTSSEFLLKLYQEEILIDNTRFYFDNDLTLGLDPGYDAGHFNQDASLISRLVEEDEGVGFAINAMGSEALSGVSIPLEVNQQSNVPFRISLEDSTIASDVEVQLEDRLLETLTLLNDEDFTLTAVEDLSGIGRFYLHLGNVTLGEDSFANSFASIYKEINDDYITIEGLPNSSKNNVSIYNLLGQLVANKSLNANQTKQTVSTKGFPSGIYLVELHSGRSVVTKKIIVK